MDRIPKPTEASVRGREEMVQGILEVLERTFPGGHNAPMDEMAEFFRGLNTATLRSIAYQQGVFEPDLEPEPADERE